LGPVSEIAACPGLAAQLRFAEFGVVAQPIRFKGVRVYMYTGKPYRYICPYTWVGDFWMFIVVIITAL
jgi:hypothetical protein